MLLSSRPLFAAGAARAADPLLAWRMLHGQDLRTAYVRGFLWTLRTAEQLSERQRTLLRRIARDRKMLARDVQADVNRACHRFGVAP
jgi:hypothetical protein